MRYRIRLLVAILGALSLPLSAQDFYGKHSEGWFWYEDPQIVDEEPKTESKSDQSQPASTKPLTPEERATQDILAFKKALEGKKNLALTHPTYENLANYMRIQKEMMDRSTRFSQSFQEVVLSEPDLNYERVYPTAQYARHIQEDEKNREKESVIRNMSREYGLFYFFKGSCPYCEGFSPIVQLFAQKYAWEIIAVSLDGSSSTHFPNAQADNGMAESLGIKAVPALVAYHAGSGELIPISYAMTSLDRLEDNIITLTQGGNHGR